VPSHPRSRYPLAHAKQDRSLPLGYLSAAARMLFVIGTKDAIALGPALDSAPLQRVLKAMPAQTTLHMVPGGAHNPLSQPKRTAEAGRQAILDAIGTFCNAAT